MLLSPTAFAFRWVRWPKGVTLNLSRVTRGSDDAVKRRTCTGTPLWLLQAFGVRATLPGRAVAGMPALVRHTQIATIAILLRIRFPTPFRRFLNDTLSEPFRPRAGLEGNE